VHNGYYYTCGFLSYNFHKQLELYLDLGFHKQAAIRGAEGVAACFVVGSWRSGLIWAGLLSPPRIVES
jgi:hypothetical protein